MSKHWTWSTIGSVLSDDPKPLCDGPFGSKLKSAHYTDSGVRVIRLGNLGVGEFKDTDRSFVSPEHAETLKRHWVREGDLLIAALAEPVGRCCLVPKTVLPALVKADCIRFRPAATLFPRFVMHWLNSPDARRAAEERSHGVGRLRINMKGIRSLPIPVPDIAEQQAIVTAIETHFSHLDAAVASLTRARANVRRARASVLKAAVEGQLVPTEAALARAEGRDYEPASALLARILAERRRKHDEARAGAKRKKRYKEPVEPDTEGLPKLPEGWCWASCAQLLDSLQTGPFGSSLHKSDYVSGGTPVVNPQHIRRLRIEPSDSATVTAETAERLSTFRMKAGDIVLGRRGKMGRCAIITTREAGWLLGTGSLSLSLARGVERPYFAWFLRSPYTVRRLEGESVGTTMTNLNQKILLSLAVPLPPLPEQHRIAAEVNRRLSVLDALDQLIATNLARCARLRQSVLKRAFEGKLVQVPAASPTSAAPPVLSPARAR